MNRSAAPPANLGRIRMRPPLGGRVGREQVRAPLNHNVVVLLKSIDPILADIAEWSDVVRKDND
jgi:hypothetical protein